MGAVAPMGEGFLLPVIQQLLGETRRAGRGNVMALCPFPHATGRDHTPSFAIHTETGLWLCHACKRCGNFRALLRGLGSPSGSIEKIVELAAEIQRESQLDVADQAVWVRAFPKDRVLPEESLGLFDEAPTDLIRAGFSKRLLRTFNVGFDRKNCRITFPLRDHTGQLVGFSGRSIFEDQVPRYKVYTKREYGRWGLPLLDPPEKGKLLWNYDQVAAISEHAPGSPVIVSEGFKSTLWLRQCGYPYVVALLGSIMTEEQQALLERLNGVLYLFLDQDPAGDHRYEMAEKLSESSDVRLPLYPRGGKLQPDALTPEEVHQALNSAPTYTSYCLNRCKQPTKYPRI